MSARHRGGMAPRGKSGHRKPNALDAAAHEAIERFARVMVRCNLSTKAIAEAFSSALATARAEVARPTQPINPELPGAAHLVTLWCTSSDYVDERGVPISLPARGAQRSLEALIQRVDRTLDLQEVIRYLLSSETMRRVGNRYVLNRRWIRLRGVSGLVHARSIGRLVGMLRTLEHNLLAESDTDVWFEFSAENPRFPVSQLEAFDGLARRTGMGWLRKLDLFMQQCEMQRDPSEPTVYLGVGMHRYQHGSVDKKRPPTPRIMTRRPARATRRRS